MYSTIQWKSSLSWKGMERKAKIHVSRLQRKPQMIMCLPGVEFRFRVEIEVMFLSFLLF